MLLWLDPCIRTRVELLLMGRRLLSLVRLGAVDLLILRWEEGRLVIIAVLVTHRRLFIGEKQIKYMKGSTRGSQLTGVRSS